MVAALSGLLVWPQTSDARQAHRRQTHAAPTIEFPHRDAGRVSDPLAIASSQYEPLRFSDIPGWNEDNLARAFSAFRSSCVPIAAQRKPPKDPKALSLALREPCRAAKAATVTDDAQARAFFERHFVALKISKLGDAAGFVTGYYEPVVEGSRTQSEVYNIPVYRRPSNLFVRGQTQSSTGLPNKGQVFRKIGRRKLVAYYDRGEIEDGAIAGRGLEICWLKSQTDLLFIQIQGSARVKLDDGSTIRLNYDAHNGFPYTPIGRVLIDRNIIPREEMSMQRIRQWLDENPDGASELRRQNRSYVFFREVQLSEKDEAVGAQGVQLTPGRSIAVDKSLHAYGTPFFIEGTLPIESATSATPFRRLMIAQDTGSAIVGPARADLYFGAGAEAGQISGRLRHDANFAILVPKSLDPSVGVNRVPLPEDRPSEAIAKLFPQTLPQPLPPSAADKPVKPVEVTEGAAPAPQTAIPLPQPRPAVAETASTPMHLMRRRHR